MKKIIIALFACALLSGISYAGNMYTATASTIAVTPATGANVINGVRIENIGNWDGGTYGNVYVVLNDSSTAKDYVVLAGTGTFTATDHTVNYKIFGGVPVSTNLTVSASTTSTKIRWTIFYDKK